MSKGYDLAVVGAGIVGAGIVGIGMALAAVRRGKRVVVIERSAKAVGASIRNFGFITVSGQKRGAHWRRARRTRDIWAELADEAGIPILHRGLVMPAYRAEAEAVIDAFLATEMGADCRRVTVAAALEEVPSLRRSGMRAALYSPHEVRVESMDALPKLAAWLAERHAVDFLWNTAVTGIAGERIATSRGVVEADACIVCPGDDFATLYPELIEPYALKVCTLQMLRVDPGAGVRLGAAVMSDQSFARYEGFRDLPAGAALAARLDAEQPVMRAAGVHLIAVQSADGTLIVGDSHVYGNAPQPFADDGIDALMLASFDALFDCPGRSVVRRWCGTYASASDRTVLIERPDDNVRLAIVTGGTGASTGFALGEEVVADLFA